VAKKKSSPAEDLLDIVSLLPWWVGVGLAVASYVILHRMAMTPPPSTLQPGHLGAAVTGMMVAALANAGQYLLPLLCSLGAAISFYRRKKREKLFTQVKEGANAAAVLVNGMSWHEFEMLVGEAFRQQGYKVLEVGGGGADGGVDLVLLRHGEKHLVQCKQWKAYKVGVSVVRELYGVMAAQGATGGYVVTSGQFTAEAKSFAEGRNLNLIDGPQLIRLIGTSPQPTRSSTNATGNSTTSEAMEDKSAKCPHCDAPMLKRVAKQGQYQGKEFWGCTTYPKCRGTRPA
jgi:restriction system protein